MAHNHIVILTSTTPAVRATGTDATSTAYSTFHSASNLIEPTRPLRTYQSQDNPALANIDLVFDFDSLGGNYKIGAAFIDNINVSAINIYNADADGSGDPDTWVQLASGAGIALDKKTGRRKLYYDFTASSALGSNKRFLRFRVASGTTTTDSLARLMVGGITFTQVANQLALPGGYAYPLDYTIYTPQVTNKFETGAYEPVIIGERFVSIKLPQIKYLQDTQESEILDILATETAPLVFYENNGDTSRAYTVRVETAKSARVTYDLKEVLTVSLALREIL